MSFTVLGGKIIARWKFEKANGKEGVGLDVLEFTFSVSGVEQEGLETVWHSPRAKVRIGELRRSAKPIGEARSNRHISMKSVDRDNYPVKLEMTVTPRQIREIEERRDNQVRFFFDIEADAIVYQDPSSHDSYPPRHRGVGTQVNYRMKEQEWLEILDNLNYADYLIEKIPLPDREHRPQMAEAIDYLRTAKTAFAERRYGDAVGECRKAVDKLNEEFGQPKKLGHLLQELSDDKNDHSKLERELLLRGALRHYTHPPHHIDIDDYTRKEASMILGVTTSLLSNTIER